MSYYLQDNPNKNTPQFGWPRTRVSGVIGVHTAENSTDFEGADPGAEDVARIIGRRTNYGSYHALADADSIIQLVHPRYAAWADTENNAHGMSVSGAMQAARRELSPARAAAITRNMVHAAAQLVRDAMAAGLLATPTPARRISPAEAISGSRAGLYGHGETNPGRWYAPGQNFDWDLFLATYANASSGITTQENITEEDELSAQDVEALQLIDNQNADRVILETRAQIKARGEELAKKIEDSEYDIKHWTQGSDNKTGDRIIDSLRADIGAVSPSTIASLIPASIAQAVADKLAKWLVK